MLISLNRFGILFVASLLGTAPVWAAEVKPAEVKPPAEADAESAPIEMNQRYFATKLVQELELGSLPKKVKDKDLLNVLSGRRTLVVEAEDHYDKKRDKIALRTFNTIGQFSGKGWLGASADPASVTFKARIPLAGIYQLKIRGAGDGQIWSVGGKAIKVDCGMKIKEVDAGTVIMDAELATFNVVLPPDGAIDVITFVAPDLPRVEPTAGWQFDAPLTYGAVAEAAAMVLKNSLPMTNDPDKKPLIIPVAGNAALPSGVSLVTDQIYGRFFGEGWFRTSYAPAKMELPFQVDAPAFYGVRVRWMGKDFVGTLDGIPVEGKGAKSLEWVDLGVYHLAKGKHLLRVDLPPAVGIDVLELTAKVSGEAASLKMLGWQQQAAQQVKPDDFEPLIADLAARYLAAGRK